jgi:hypothetical protein
VVHHFRFYCHALLAALSRPTSTGRQPKPHLPGSSGAASIKGSGTFPAPREFTGNRSLFPPRPPYGNHVTLVDVIVQIYPTRRIQDARRPILDRVRIEFDIVAKADVSDRPLSPASGKPW